MDNKHIEELTREVERYNEWLRELSKGKVIAPCPFCGGKAGLSWRPESHPLVSCNACYAQGPGITKDADDAFERWNKRAVRVAREEID